MRPTGSGKTVAAELALWWALRERPGRKVVYVAPMKALVRERMRDWGSRLAGGPGGPGGLRLVELTGDSAPDARAVRDAHVIVTTPEKWDGISRGWRGPRLRAPGRPADHGRDPPAGRRPRAHPRGHRVARQHVAASTGEPVRLLGMSTACANARDLADWLGVPPQGLFNFRHSVRPVPLELYIDGFPTGAASAR